MSVSNSDGDKDDKPKESKDATNPLCSTENNTKKTFRHAALPRLELLLCFLITAGFLVYMKYRTSVISKEHLAHMKVSYLPKGWLPLGHGKLDAADYEWLAFKNRVLKMPVLYWILAYVFIGRLVEACFPKFRKHFILAFSIGALCARMTPRVFLFFTIHTVFSYLASRTGIKFIVWLVGILQTLSVVYSFAFLSLQESIFPGLIEDMIGFTFGLMKFISFGVECCREGKNYGLFDFLLYVYYFPLFSFGPVLTFDQFDMEINKEYRPLNRKELLFIVKQIVRHLFWFIYVEVILHFLYFTAIHRHAGAFKRLSPGDLAVLAGCHLINFQNKYVILYGAPGVLALFDRVNAPPAPRCPLGVYSYREMWKDFDRGLHNMLVRYIYGPLGGSKHGPKWASFASFVAFFAVGLWHGNAFRQYMWVFCNWIGVQMERLIMEFAWSSPVATKYRSQLSGPMVRRLCGLAAALSQMSLSLFSLIYVVGSLPVFWVYANGFFIQGFPWTPVILFIFFYFNVQLDIEVQRWVSIENLFNKKNV